MVTSRSNYGNFGVNYSVCLFTKVSYCIGGRNISLRHDAEERTGLSQTKFINNLNLAM